MNPLSLQQHSGCVYLQVIAFAEKWLVHDDVLGGGRQPVNFYTITFDVCLSK